MYLGRLVSALLLSDRYGHPDHAMVLIFVSSRKVVGGLDPDTPDSHRRMPDAIISFFRPLLVEDFGGQNGVGAAKVAGMVNRDVLGTGNVPVTPFVAAPDDDSVFNAGIPYGGVYIHTAPGQQYLAVMVTRQGGYGVGPLGDRPLGE